MLSRNTKDEFERLQLNYPAVAVKFCYSQPEGIRHVGKVLSFCQFVKEAQDTGEMFYVTKDDDNCSGKMVLGMIPTSGFNMRF